MKKKGLGTGLGALFGDAAVEPTPIDFEYLPLQRIEPRQEQPRTVFEQKKIDELADSIRVHGILSPLMVRSIEGGFFQIIAGERRWRAARAAGLTEIPVVIREMSDEEAMVAALIENLQREDLNAMEEARGYRSLMEEYNLTQDEAARRVGKSRSKVANALRLLLLPGTVQELVKDQRLSEGHARALMGLEEGVEITPVAQEIAEKGLNVRDSEKLIKRRNQDAQVKSPPPEAKRGEIIAQILPQEMRPPKLLEEVRLSMSEALGRKVKIVPKGYDSGQLVIEFYSLEDLMGLARGLGGV